jgi:hypothetical protein
MLAQTRAEARGALFLDACRPVSEFGGECPRLAFHKIPEGN